MQGSLTTSPISAPLSRCTQQVSAVTGHSMGHLFSLPTWLPQESLRRVVPLRAERLVVAYNQLADHTALAHPLNPGLMHVHATP